MINPVARPSRANDPLQLVRLDPEQLLHKSVAPDVEALAAELHGAAGHPKKDDAVVLQHLNVHPPHLVVRHRAVRQLHVDIPRRIGHDDGEFTQHGHRERADVAVDELRLIVARKGVMSELVGCGASKRIELSAAAAHLLDVGISPRSG